MIKTPEEILLEIKELEKQLSKLTSELYKVTENKYSCCSELCATFKSELDSIESQIMEIDKLAYKRFPLFVQYFAKTKIKDNKVTLKEYTESVFKNKKDREAFINYFYKQKKTKEIFDKKEILKELLTQIKNNNICRCENDQKGRT